MRMMIREKKKEQDKNDNNDKEKKGTWYPVMRVQLFTLNGYPSKANEY